jgi:dolichyl-phosphate-mannose--protein O-mannosyl transferase
VLGSYRELLKTSGGRSKLAWLAYTFVVSLAAGLRFWNLGNPHKLVFDETYYVKDAYTLSRA